MKTREIVNIIHRFAPPALASDWDNVGFLLGDAEQEVKKVLLSLDVTPNTVKKAVETNTDLIITHHPLIFRPIKKITNPLYLTLIKNNISVISAHTNLDTTSGGVNHKLAEIFGLKDLELLSTKTGNEIFQVSALVPPDALEKVQNAVFSTGAGNIGNYSNCMSSWQVNGQYLPDENSNPAIGEKGRLELTKEVRIEFVVDSFNLQKTINALLKAHPYETPAYAVYPQHKTSERFGLGLIGKLNKPVTIQEFAEVIKEKLSAPFLKIWLANKNQDSLVSKIALCGGAGASLISAATGRADLYLSGEFGYHSSIDSNIPLIAAGHFHTEFPVLEVLRDLIQDEVDEVEILPFELHEINNKQFIIK